VKKLDTDPIRIKVMQIRNLEEVKTKFKIEVISIDFKPIENCILNQKYQAICHTIVDGRIRI